MVNLFGILIKIEVDGSVGVGVMSRDKVGHGPGRNAQGPQDCVCMKKGKGGNVNLNWIGM